MEPDEQTNNRVTEHLKPWQFKPGQSGNPNGRPKGTVSLKQYAKKYLEELDEEGKLEFMKGLDKVDIWKLAEGNPQNNTELSRKIETTNSIAAEILTEADRLLKEKKINAETSKSL